MSHVGSTRSAFMETPTEHRLRPTGSSGASQSKINSLIENFFNWGTTLGALSIGLYLCLPRKGILAGSCQAHSCDLF